MNYERCYRFFLHKKQKLLNSRKITLKSDGAAKRVEFFKIDDAFACVNKKLTRQ